MKNKTNGFLLSEVIVSLFLITIVVAVIAGLGQQVMQFSKSAKQTGAVVDLRSKSVALVKDPDRWLAKLRGMTNFAQYNACFPDINSTSTAIKCPSADPSIFENNPGLNNVASGYVGITAPLVDEMGEEIAGTESNPQLLTADGAKCDGPKKSCPLRSVAYFLRSTPEQNVRPTTVRFVIRIDKNPLHLSSGTLPMKAQYVTMDVNTQSASALCPSGSLKLGTLSDGKPYCVPTTSACSSGKVAIGVNSSGSPVCENVPSCGPNSRHIVLNPSSGKLECTPDPSPCPVGSPYLGNFAGTNEPICSNGLGSCPNGVMMGVEEQNGSLVSKCVALPTSNCSAQNQSITFDGSKFVCQAAALSKDCIGTDVVVGINPDGSPKCADLNTKIVANTFICPDGQYMKGFTPEGPVCKDLAVVPPVVPPVTPTCNPAFYINNSDPKVVADIKSQLDVFHFRYGHTTGHVGGNAGNGYKGSSPMTIAEIGSYRTILSVSKHSIYANHTRGWTNYRGYKWFVNNVPELNEVWWFEMSNVPGTQLHCQDPNGKP